MITTTITIMTTTDHDHVIMITIMIMTTIMTTIMGMITTMAQR